MEVKRGISWSKEQEHPVPRDGAVPVIRIGNVQERLELDDLIYISSLKPKAVEKKRVSAGWSVMVGSNGNRQRIGNAVLIGQDKDFLFASFLIAARPKEDSGIAPDFFYRWLSAERGQAYLSASSEGTTGLSNLSHSFFKAMAIPFPKEPGEQAAIARVLDAVDTALERTRAAIARARELRDSLIRESFESGIDENGQIRNREKNPSAFATTELGTLPKTWSVQSLINVAEVERGRFTPRPRNDPRFYNGPYPFVQTGQIAAAKGRVITTFAQTLNSLGKAVSREFPAGTIIVTIAANIGETAILGIPMCATDSLVGVSVKGKNVARYVELCLRRLRRKLLALAPRSAQANINLATLKPLRIPVAPPAEQRRIASLVDASDAYVQTLEFREEALVVLKKSLMHDLLTGRVRVPPARTPSATRNPSPCAERVKTTR